MPFVRGAYKAPSCYGSIARVSDGLIIVAINGVKNAAQHAEWCREYADCAFLAGILFGDSCDVSESELRRRVQVDDGIPEDFDKVVYGLIGGVYEVGDSSAISACSSR